MLGDKIQQKQAVSRWSLADDASYLAWKNLKLADLSQRVAPVVTPLKSLKNPSDSERKSLVAACNSTNMALYEVADSGATPDEIRTDLRCFVDAMGLKIAESHRSAGDSGIVSLKVTEAEKQRGFIPYSRKPMNWHTDGYYNSPKEQIGAMVLHCVHPADDGGQNQLLDPEIAYIRLRDENPAFIIALMHKSAMRIPENREADGTLRPVSIGPVFSVTANDQLSMRYTARTRSISWRDDKVTRQAVAFLQDLLEQGDPLMQTLTLKAGQGILNNNVLHNRTGFDADKAQTSNRLIYRIRFHNRVAEA